MNLLDRFLFAEVMEDNETLENVLEIIQGYPVPLEDKAQAEKELRRTPRNKRSSSMCTEKISGMPYMMWRPRRRIRMISPREPGITTDGGSEHAASG